MIATSDSPIVSELSITDASGRFADMLDAVEHRGETFTVVRGGRAVATLAPARRATLGQMRTFLSANPPDAEWAEELEDLRRFVCSACTAEPWVN